MPRIPGAHARYSSLTAGVLRIAALGALLTLLCLAASAQQAATPPTDPGYVPLTGPERWRRFTRGYLASPGTYFAAAGAALGGEISNEPKEWGRGIDGYGRRVGTEFAQFTIHTGVHEAGDALLGLDPRYFPCRCAGGWRRTGHALAFTFLAYDAHGRKRVDWPQLAGAYGSTMTVTTWYPSHYSPLVQGVQQGHQEMGLVLGVNLVREFRPELKRFFGHFH